MLDATPITALTSHDHPIPHADIIACDQDGIVGRLIQRTVRKVVSHPAIATGDAPDVEQELRLALWRKWPAYDPARSSVATFVRQIVESEGISLVRKHLAAKRDARRNRCSLNDYVGDAEGQFIERSQTLDESKRHGHRGCAARPDTELSALRMDCEDAVTSLPSDLRRVCEALSRYSISDAARELGVSRHRLYADISQIRVLFEDRGLAQYVDCGGQSREPVRMEFNSDPDCCQSRKSA